MLCTLLVVPCLSLMLPTQDAAADADALRAAAPEAVVAAFDGFADEPWPGFRPKRYPLAIWDGTHTWLVRHPAPPEGYRVLDATWAVRDGREPEVVANSSAVIGGTLSATLMADRGALSPPALAAILVHESFHAFQGDALPGWRANEGELFTYPFDDGDLLAGRRLETHALREASLALAAGREDDAFAWGRSALDARASRFARLDAGAVAYERGLELREGLAQYLQYRAHDERATTPLPADGYAAEALRDRVYATGEAWGRLLDAAAPGWPARVPADGSRAPDELFDDALRALDVAPRELASDVREAIVARARADAAAVRDARASERAAYLARDGWTVIVEPRAPLPLGSFDPLNVRNLGGRDVLHTRMLRLRDGSTRIEVDDASVLTHGAGTHPLFDGVDRLVAAGLPERPRVLIEGDVTALVAGGLAVEARGAELETDEAARTLTLRFRDATR